MKIKVDSITVNTIEGIFIFNDVEIYIDKNNVALMIYEDNHNVTTFILNNVIYFNVVTDNGGN